MTLIDVKTGTITRKGQIVIPKGIRDMFETGTKVAFLAYEDRIEIRPLDEIDTALSCAYASEKTLAKEWLLEEEDEAWKNL
ncbi:AbrB/MazE/SpoVT family DNA-binding domain-containing protein [Methanoplanus endosymbiosus]|uniref:AbrB/MazE/SpoVT family DNA-binding domain-containing protein n=1 Tax=Methanoplanus endosymbiosus TaxID=33865 RepID=A0A9E7THK4_9EURY|nr:AbrB/MazE/SpoVT family DNA-binding domain-containing protein [Methanoplanus endosymbiosus]UUX93132.1 AbrB/MazE/SpoVT family DNA-binding domain-containing protein [Methanoplanus endosymbiosus]